MAMADYRCCDMCGCKAFYDANLSYHFKGEPDPYNIYTDRPFIKFAGKDPAQYKLDNLGDWAVLCAECSNKYKTAIVPIKE